MMVRILCFCALFAAAIVLPWWLVAPFALVYAFAFRAYELLALAACIDAYFGAAAQIPYYTLGALSFMIVAEFVKPYLSFYSR